MYVFYYLNLFAGIFTIGIALIVPFSILSVLNIFLGALCLTLFVYDVIEVTG